VSTAKDHETARRIGRAGSSNGKHVGDGRFDERERDGEGKSARGDPLRINDTYRNDGQTADGESSWTARGETQGFLGKSDSHRRICSRNRSRARSRRRHPRVREDARDEIYRARPRCVLAGGAEEDK